MLLFSSELSSIVETENSFVHNFSHFSTEKEMRSRLFERTKREYYALYCLMVKYLLTMDLFSLLKSSFEQKYK